MQALHHSLQREVSTTRTDQDRMESETEQIHIGESEGMKRKGEEERLFQLQRLKALFFSLAQNVEKKNKMDECFSSLKKEIRTLSIKKGADWFSRSSRTRNFPKMMTESFSFVSSSKESHLKYPPDMLHSE